MIITKIILIFLIAVFLWGFLFPYKFLDFYCRLLSFNLKAWGIETQFKITATNKIKFLCLIFVVFISYILYLQIVNQNQNNTSNINDNTSLVLLKDGGAIEAKIDKEDSEKIYFQHNTSTINKKDIDTILRINEKDFLDVIFNRNSCYDFKYGAEIPDNHIQLMLRAAMCCPSGYNLRFWRFIVVKDKEQIQSLLLPIIDEDGVGRGRLNANLMFVVCNKENTEISNGWTDALLASVYLWLCAEYLNYAAALVDILPGPNGEKREKLFREKLSIPNDIYPFYMILVGYYAEDKRPINKFDISNIHYDSWN